jgi:hypothetical protein
MLLASEGEGRRPDRSVDNRAQNRMQYVAPNSLTECARDLLVQLSSELAAMSSVVTPIAQRVQLPSAPMPAFHSPRGQGATWPGPLR